MSNSPKMLAFIANAESYLLSLGKEELNRRIDSRKDSDIGKLILDAGFLEKENLAEETTDQQFEDQIKYVKYITLHEMFDWTLNQKYSTLDWSRVKVDKFPISYPLHLQEMFFIPKTVYDYLSKQEGLNDYMFEGSTECLKIA